jgi:hypothetical protein
MQLLAFALRAIRATVPLSKTMAVGGEGAGPGVAEPRRTMRSENGHMERGSLLHLCNKFVVILAALHGYLLHLA